MQQFATVDPSAVKRPSSRLLMVLDAFADSRAVLGVSELAEAAGLPKSTAHRLLSTLVASGYVGRVGDRYRLAEHAFEMGNLMWACRPGGLRERAIPYMIELAQQTRETVHLAILDNYSVLYLEKLFGHQATPCPTSVGSRRPTHCTALGKALLAHSPGQRHPARGLRRYTPATRTTEEALSRDLERARGEGVAAECEEFRTGLMCVAAPILEHPGGPAIAAISVSTTPGRANLRRLASQVLRATEPLNRPTPPAARYVG
jgi:DNA-binding IclR family transcriptional regulator